MSGTALQSEKPQHVLTAHDRCMGCSGQAYIKVETLDMGEFLFCMHHWISKKTPTGKSNKDLLEDIALHVLDESDRLLPQPYDPATDNS